MQKLHYIDLCSGIGGFRIAINNYSNDTLKFECVLSADIKKDAIDTYNINFSENNEKLDINNIIPEEIDSFDLLCAGFPCQPFSSAGNKKGFSDKRGGLIFKIVDICKYHKPQTVLLENVSNILTLDKGKCIIKIIELFENIGYKVSYIKLNSKDFGCPQSRDRVYIICSLNKVINFDKLKYRENKYIKDIIDYKLKDSNIDEEFSKKIISLHKNKSLYGCKLNDKRGGAKNIHSWDIGLNGIISTDETKLMSKIMLERRKKHWAEKKGIKWMDGMPLTKNEILTFFEHDNLLYKDLYLYIFYLYVLH
jgi:DNA (cytosine-5)-methyltransferase 1